MNESREFSPRTEDESDFSFGGLYKYQIDFGATHRSVENQRKRNDSQSKI